MESGLYQEINKKIHFLKMFLHPLWQMLCNIIFHIDSINFDSLGELVSLFTATLD